MKISNPTAIIIVLATISFMWLYIWPKFRKDTNIEIEDWKDIFKKILPSFIAKYFNLLFPAIIFVIVMGGLGIFVDSQPSGSLFNAVFTSILLLICFLGLNKLIKLENPEAGAGQQILLWGIYGLIIFTMIHNTFNEIITNNMYFVGMIGGISMLTFALLMTQGPFKILLSGALLCSIFILRSYINTGYLPFTNGENWEGYWPIILIAIATTILFITSHKQIKWYERWSCWAIRGIAIIIMCPMILLVALMMIDRIRPDDISRIAEYNRTANFSKKSYSSTWRKKTLVDYKIRESEKLLERFNRDDPSVTTDDMNKATANRELAVEKFYNGAEKIVKNAPKRKSIENLVFSELISLFREYKNKISIFITRLQL
ncbi:MAG: hypothetical protein U9O55_02995 [Patescibacteria group bacterium]|nr:hypothetical protein [Patescibacteria group bacterium]